MIHMHCAYLTQTTPLLHVPPSCMTSLQSLQVTLCASGLYKCKSDGYAANIYMFAPSSYVHVPETLFYTLCIIAKQCSSAPPTPFSPK